LQAGALSFSVMGTGFAQAQGPTPPAPPQPQLRMPATQLPADLTALAFSRAPSGVVPLRGRSPGDSFLFETISGIRPLRYELTVQPAVYSQYFSVIGVRTQAGPGDPIRQPEPALARQPMAIKFAGLPASQGFPQNIEVFLRVTDARERRIEKLFNVRLTNSAAAPVLRNILHDPGAYFSVVGIDHSGFSFDEAGSYVEARYVTTGLRYRCVRGDACIIEEGPGNVTFRVPRLQDQGRDVDIRLVNDTAASSYGRVKLSEGLTSQRLFVTIPGAIVSAGAQYAGTNPLNLSGSRNSCDQDYAVWRAIDSPEEVSAHPVNVPVAVTMETRPEICSRMVGDQPIVYSWTAAAVEYIRFYQPVEYHTYRGKCANRVIGN
jgi:hypothetical protein